MSSYYDPSKSEYLRKTSTSLREYREKKRSDIKEIFACDPTNCELSDDRTDEDMYSTIDLEKFKKAMTSCDVTNKSSVWVVICCGSFAPIHSSHIKMGKSALKALTSQTTSSVGVMAYYIPNNSSYTALKLQKRGDDVPKFVQKEHVVQSLKHTFKDEPNLGKFHQVITHTHIRICTNIFYRCMYY